MRVPSSSASNSFGNSSSTNGTARKNGRSNRVMPTLARMPMSSPAWNTCSTCSGRMRGLWLVSSQREWSVPLPHRLDGADHGAQIDLAGRELDRRAGAHNSSRARAAGCPCGPCRSPRWLWWWPLMRPRRRTGGRCAGMTSPSGSMAPCGRISTMRRPSISISTGLSEGIASPRRGGHDSRVLVFFTRRLRVKPRNGAGFQAMTSPAAALPRLTGEATHALRDPAKVPAPRSVQRALARGQRGWKAQPEGGDERARHPRRKAACANGRARADPARCRAAGAYRDAAGRSRIWRGIAALDQSGRDTHERRGCPPCARRPRDCARSADRSAQLALQPAHPD